MKRNDLARYIKQNRQVLGLTQCQIAKQTGVGLRFVRELEQGKETLRMDKVNLVLTMFGQKLGVIPMSQEDRDGAIRQSIHE